MEEQSLETGAHKGEGVIVNTRDGIMGEVKVTEGGKVGELVILEAGEAIVRQGEALEERTSVETSLR